LAFWRLTREIVLATGKSMRRIAIVILLLLIGVSLLLLFLPRLTAASPTQPIAFSHKAHAGVRQIPCTFCHKFAVDSTVAGIPTVERCAGCHLVVKTDDPEVQKVMGYWNNRQPIPWVRVNRVPDFVYFTHEMHIAANVDCSSCHGNVAAMDRITQPQALTMGWCLNCHRSRGASADCWTCHK
jgi:hypothetical protein